MAQYFRGIGRGAFENRLNVDKEAYRTVYAVRSGKRVCCTPYKKSPRGIETPRPHMEVIKRRYKEAVSEWRESEAWREKKNGSTKSAAAMYLRISNLRMRRSF